ncbi:MAG: substrate-binding domain-containing protein [Actinobacteria bacterium]|nr:substrate-binding domain-containing protein [Actinomycetota bacterium]
MLATMALVATVALAACGGGSSSSSSSSPAETAGPESGQTESATKTTVSTEGCGEVPSKPPNDPEGLLAEFPGEVQDAFNLYPATLAKSAWSKFKPSHPGPYRIALSATALSDPFSEEFIELMEKHKGEGGLVSEIKIASSNGDIQTQIRQVQQMIREKYDAIVLFQGSSAADAKVEEEAGKAGIPLIGPLQFAENPWMVGIYGNEFLKGAEMMSGLAPLMENKGSLLEVYGLHGLPSTDGVLAGIESVLAGCPDINVVGEVEGKYSTAVAKTGALQFLAAHPEKIDGVIQTGGMGPGLIEAFEQTGREVPPLGDNGAAPGVLAYWQQNKGTYKGATSVGLQVPVLVEATWATVEALLEGRGVKMNQISWEPPVIDEENLDEWVEPGWTLQTPLLYAPGPGSPFPPDYLENFFVNPAK